MYFENCVVGKPVWFLNSPEQLQTLKVCISFSCGHVCVWDYVYMCGHKRKDHKTSSL